MLPCLALIQCNPILRIAPSWHSSRFRNVLGMVQTSVLSYDLRKA
jgi:hypothetical protein